jgi:diketogulonate reductase-like aldo/keto reductase
MDFGGQPLLKMNNGLMIPQLGFGVLGIPELSDTEKACLEAIKIGYRHIDTAHLYDNERGVGTALQKCGLPRKDIFITTKLAPTDLGEKITEKAIDAMLKRFNTDYIDLLLIHHPFNDYVGAWKDMEKAVKEGKVKSIGLSNFEGKHWKDIMDVCTIKPAVLQLEGHPYWNQHELKKRNKLTETLMQAWFPIGHGDKKLLGESIFVELGKKYNKTPAQIILRWHIQEGNIPLPKSSNPEHMKENFNIFDFKLTDEEMEKINQLPQKRYFDVPGSQVEGSKWVKIFNDFKAKHD